MFNEADLKKNLREKAPLKYRLVQWINCLEWVFDGKNRFWFNVYFYLAWKKQLFWFKILMKKMDSNDEERSSVKNTLL